MIIYIAQVRKSPRHCDLMVPQMRWSSYVVLNR